MRVPVALSQFVACHRNPRRVNPERDAHRRLVAPIRAHGLLEPLVVRPVGETRTRGARAYPMIAGTRRLAALREIHRGDADPPIPCGVCDVDDLTADTLRQVEGFADEGMHPLDEADSWARLTVALGAYLGFGHAPRRTTWHRPAVAQGEPEASPPGCAARRPSRIVRCDQDLAICD